MLEAAGFDPIYELGKDCELAEAVRSVRPRDVVGVTRLWVVADPKRGRKGGMRKALYAAADAIEERGAVIEEVETGRVSSDPKQRDAMMRDAIEAVTKAGRGMSSAANARKGRKAVEFSEAATEKAKAVWHSRKHKTWADAAAAMPKGFTVHRAFKLWGKRNAD